jgi:type I restriction enzyme S subunit
MYSNALMNEMANTMHGGSYPSLNKKDIENFKIPIPPIEEQRKVISEIDKLEKLKMENQKIIDNAVENKNVIIKKYL